MIEIAFVMRLGCRYLFRVAADVVEAREGVGVGGVARPSVSAAFALLKVDASVAFASLVDVADCYAVTRASSQP